MYRCPHGRATVGILGPAAGPGHRPRRTWVDHWFEHLRKKSRGRTEGCAIDGFAHWWQRQAVPVLIGSALVACGDSEGGGGTAPGKSDECSNASVAEAVAGLGQEDSGMAQFEELAKEDDESTTLTIYSEHVDRGPRHDR